MISVPPVFQGVKQRFKHPKKLLAVALLTLALSLVACNTSAAPSACVEAAEAAGLPESVIEQLKKPGELNAIERIALREALKKAGLDDVCDRLTKGSPQ